MQTAQVINAFPEQAQGITEGRLQEWITSHDGNHCTKRAYQTAIRQMMQYFTFIGKTQPERSDLHAWRTSLMPNHSAGTVSLYITAARLFFQWMEQENLYQDISRGIKGCKIDKGFKKDCMTDEQAFETIKAGTSKRDRAMLALMFTAGVRCIEVSRADIQDINTSAGTPVLWVQGKGKESKSDYVKLSTNTYKLLLKYLADKKETTGALFTSTSNNSAGQRLTTTSISAIAKQAMKAAGYDSKRLTAHSTRHTAATVNMIQGGSCEDTQHLLRHESYGTTQIYAQHIDRMKNNSEQRIDDAIFKGREL